jgi:zinc protease
MLFNTKPWVLALCVLAVGAKTWAVPLLVKTEQHISEYRLDNGLRVVLAPNAQENKIYINTIYFTGSLDDPQHKGGLAHLLEHLAFKGTQNIPGERFQQQLDQYTLSNNASTTYFSTEYLNYVRPDPKSYSKVLQLEAERMDKLVLQEKFIPTEIEIVRREREIRTDQPLSLLIDQVFKLAYGNQAFGRLPIGDLDELKSIQLPELQHFYRRHYAPNNAAIVIAGQFDAQTMLKQIELHFGNIAARPMTKRAAQPQPDLSQLSQAQRQLSVAKGSEYAKFMLFLAPDQPQQRPALTLVPYLLAMQPSGQLYQTLVQNGIATGVTAPTMLSPDYNLILVGATYAPSQDAQLVENRLAQQLQPAPRFSTEQLVRIKNILKNGLPDLLADADTLGAVLSGYLVEQGNWEQFFVDQSAIQQLKLEQVNQAAQQIFQPQHRLLVNLSPTPESEKQLINQPATAQSDRLPTQKPPAPEPFKNLSAYQQDIKQHLQQSQPLLSQLDQQITRGQLSNGLRYALYPTQTKDNRVYATIKLHFGDEKSLFGKREIAELMAYLLDRGAENYTHQEIIDKSIALDGGFDITGEADGLSINIEVRKENFAAYFDFVMALLKHPKFSQQEFDLAKAQTLQSLEQPLTEPATVSALTLSRLLERYQPGDIRYHVEPERLKKTVAAIKLGQVKDFYQQFISMSHAEVAITGEFEPKTVLASLEQQLATWQNQQPYQPILNQYFDYSAQTKHMLAEQREFGNYRAVLQIPAGDRHPDIEAIIVMNKILGGSQLSSRLATALREKNALIYAFDSSLSRSPESNLSQIHFSANYRPDQAAQVSQTIHQVINDLIVHGITEQELQAAKADILKKRLSNYQNKVRVHYMLDDQLYDHTSFAEAQQRDQRFAQLTVAAVNRVIRQYLKPEHLLEVMADPYGTAP